MLKDLFGKPQKDPLLRAADYTQGAYSILVGAAANKSIETDSVIKINQLVSGLSAPKFPPMPGDDEQIDYVKDVRRTVGGKEMSANVPSSISAPE